MGQNSKLAATSSRPVRSTGDRCKRESILFNGFYGVIFPPLTIECLVHAGPEFHLVQLTILAQFLAIIAASASGKLYQR